MNYEKAAATDAGHEAERLCFEARRRGDRAAAERHWRAACAYRAGAPVPAKSGFDSKRWCLDALALSASIRAAAPPRRSAAQMAAYRRDVAAIRAVLASGGRRAEPAVKEDAVDRAAREGRLFGMPHNRE